MLKIMILICEQPLIENCILYKIHTMVHAKYSIHMQSKQGKPLWCLCKESLTRHLKTVAIQTSKQFQNY